MNENFQAKFHQWFWSASLEDKMALEEHLRGQLPDAWANADSPTKKLILVFLRSAGHEEFGLIIEALKDEDLEVSALAVSMLSLLAWEGQPLEPVYVIEALDEFVERHPEWREVCDSVKRRL